MFGEFMSYDSNILLKKMKLCLFELNKKCLEYEHNSLMLGPKCLLQILRINKVNSLLPCLDDKEKSSWSGHYNCERSRLSPNLKIIGFGTCLPREFEKDPIVIILSPKLRVLQWIATHLIRKIRKTNWKAHLLLMNWKRYIFLFL